MLTDNFDLSPPQTDERGPDFEVDSFGGRNPVTKAVRIRESAKPASPDTTSSFDDTFQEKPAIRTKRLKESQPWQFSRGVPTNDKTSSENYDKDRIKIIDGEHKTLTTLGKINEAMEGDEHEAHIREHRLLLASGDLSETQRNALLEHIADHAKKHGKKLKAIAEARNQRPDITKHTGYRKGFGNVSRALPATTYDVIPQDTQVDTERKRTAGNIAMESCMRRFNRAVKVAAGRRSL